MNSPTIISLNRPLLKKPEEFENSFPINELSEALKLLAVSRNDRTRRFLVLDHDPPYIEVQQWNGGYTGSNYRGSTFFQLTPDLAKVLQEKYTEGVVYRAKVQDEGIRELTDAGYDQINERLS